MNIKILNEYKAWCKRYDLKETIEGLVRYEKEYGPKYTLTIYDFHSQIKDEESGHTIIIENGYDYKSKIDYYIKMMKCIDANIIDNREVQ